MLKPLAAHTHVADSHTDPWRVVCAVDLALSMDCDVIRDGHPQTPLDPVEFWIIEARGGSTLALDRLLEFARPGMTRTARGVMSAALRAKLDADDIVQQAALLALANFANFRGATRRELVAWLSRIVVNQAMAAGRRFRHTRKRDVGREQSLDQRPLLGRDLIDQRPDPARATFLSDDWQRCQRALLTLAPRMRLALQLRYFERQTYGEIGRRLGCSEDAARQVCRRALSRLRQCLDRRP